jgi:hypothetical protein
MWEVWEASGELEGGSERFERAATAEASRRHPFPVYFRSPHPITPGMQKSSTELEPV